MDNSPLPYNPLYPQSWYHAMCRTTPVAFHQQHQAWNVFGFLEAQHVLHHPELFSSRIPLGRGLQDSLVAVDPPDHTRLRHLVSKAFTPRMIEQLRPRIQQITDQLLNAAIERGQMDVIDDLAYPLPIMVIAELLGVPSEDRVQFRRWSDAVVQRTLDPEHETAMKNEMAAYFSTIMKQRRKAPADDLISALVIQQEEEQMSLEEVLAFCVLLLVAGNETTTNLIGNAMLCFHDHPDIIEQLRDEPVLIPGAIEEVLRYRSPIQMIGRIAVKNGTLGDQQMRNGQRVLIWVAAANLDERVFPDPLSFTIQRTPNRHIAFGNGIHFCLGAPLARLEAHIVFTSLFGRCPPWYCAELPQPITNAGTQGIKHFPVIFRES